MPLHKPGNTHAKKRKKEKKEEKVMTEEKESVVHSADENVKLLYTCTQKCKAERHGRGVFSELMQYMVYQYGQLHVLYSTKKTKQNTGEDYEMSVNQIVCAYVAIPGELAG